MSYMSWHHFCFESTHTVPSHHLTISWDYSETLWDLGLVLKMTTSKKVSIHCFVEMWILLVRGMSNIHKTLLQSRVKLDTVYFYHADLTFGVWCFKWCQAWKLNKMPCQWRILCQWNKLLLLFLLQLIYLSERWRKWSLLYLKLGRMTPRSNHYGVK